MRVRLVIIGFLIFIAQRSHGECYSSPESLLELYQGIFASADKDDETTKLILAALQRLIGHCALGESRLKNALERQFNDTYGVYPEKLHMYLMQLNNPSYDTHIRGLDYVLCSVFSFIEKIDAFKNSHNPRIRSLSRIAYLILAYVGLICHVDGRCDLELQQKKGQLNDLLLAKFPELKVLHENIFLSEPSQYRFLDDVVSELIHISESENSSCFGGICMTGYRGWITFISSLLAAPITSIAFYKIIYWLLKFRRQASVNNAIHDENLADFDVDYGPPGDDDDDPPDDGNPRQADPQQGNLQRRYPQGGNPQRGDPQLGNPYRRNPQLPEPHRQRGNNNERVPDEIDLRGSLLQPTADGRYLRRSTRHLFFNNGS